MILGSHMTEEQRANVSAAHLGTRHAVSLITRAQISAALRGRPKDDVTREKLSMVGMGHPVSAETRLKISVTHMGKLNRHWKGGKKMAVARHGAKRRVLGFLPLNSPFTGCEGHHVDKEQVINMPKILHRSVYHNQATGRGMAAINAIAYNFLFKQEVEAAMAIRGGTGWPSWF